MRSNLNKQAIIYGILAIICFLALLFGSMPLKVSKEKKAEIIIFGDSIIGGCRDETSVPALMGEYLGEPVYNAALGGTCYSYMDKDMRLAYTKDCFNMVGLAQAFYVNDFRLQKHAQIRESATEYFEDVIYELSVLDLNAADTIVLLFGMNDYHGAAEFSNPEDSYDPYTFTGAIRSSVRYLRETVPECRIVLATPTYSWYPSTGITCEEYNTGNGTLETYVNAEIAVAEELGLEVIDLYHGLYAHENYEDWQIYTIDGLHPNEAGRILIAHAIADYL